MQRIIGREKELAALRALWTSEKSEFVAVHGRRRVGKTFLIRTAFEEAFAFQIVGFGDYVDLCTIAKTIQLGATLYTEEYNPKPGLIAGTYTASTVSLSAGIKTLKTLLNEAPSKKFFGADGKIQKIHENFIKMLSDLQQSTCKGLIKDFGGLGLMIAMTPYDGSKDRVMKLLQTLFKNGIVAFSCGHGPFKVRFLLPAILENKHIEEIKGILEKSLLENRE